VLADAPHDLGRLLGAEVLLDALFPETAQLGVERLAALVEVSGDAPVLLALEGADLLLALDATDCTRPADSPLAIFFQSSGLSL
jgi:hypothetical protein